MSVLVARDSAFILGKKTYVMGILNITDDSFSDGGLYNSPEAALSHVENMRALGADIIDIGANSTRPGAEILNEAEELERLKAILPQIAKAAKPFSVDTFYPACARFALENGACMINDVSGSVSDEMISLAKEFGAALVITHNPCGAGEEAEYKDGVIPAVRDFFLESLKKCFAAGLKQENICLDAGIGFGKTQEQNLEILKNMQWLKFSGIALLAGASRKRVVGIAAGEENAAKRDAGTVAAHTAAIEGGADIIRVHDVFGGVQGARVADALYRGDN